MTKTLTEQWRDGTLPEGDYYIEMEDYIIIDYWYCNHWEWTENESRIKEVLAPVPSYEEFVQQRDFVKDHLKVLIENMNLKRKLEIATKALQYYEDGTLGSSVSRQALKEMEGVK